MAQLPKGDPRDTSPAFFAVMAVLFAALFVLNMATHGSWFGIIVSGVLRQRPQKPPAGWLASLSPR